MKETRIASCSVALREDGGAQFFTGQPITYNEWSHPIYGMFRERILPGAFDECLARSPDIYACIGHDASRLLARTGSGTMRLMPSNDGISIEIKRPKVSYADDLAELIARGDMRGMSFIFDVKSDNYYREDGKLCRDVKKADIYEVSYVTDPAYPQTTAGLRSMTAAPEEIKQEIEKRLQTPLATLLAELQLLELL